MKLQLFTLTWFGTFLLWGLPRSSELDVTGLSSMVNLCSIEVNFLSHSAIRPFVSLFSSSILHSRRSTLLLPLMFLEYVADLGLWKGRHFAGPLHRVPGAAIVVTLVDSFRTLHVMADPLPLQPTTDSSVPQTSSTRLSFLEKCHQKLQPYTTPLPWPCDSANLFQ